MYVVWKLYICCSMVRVTRSLTLCACLVDRCLSFFSLSVVCPSIYGFRLPVWYLQTLLNYLIYVVLMTNESLIVKLLNMCCMEDKWVIISYLFSIWGIDDKWGINWFIYLINVVWRTNGPLLVKLQSTKHYTEN